MGRLFGEGVAYISTGRDVSGQQWTSVNPGGYALAGGKPYHLYFFAPDIRVRTKLLLPLCF